MSADQYANTAQFVATVGFALSLAGCGFVTGWVWAIVWSRQQLIYRIRALHAAGRLDEAEATITAAELLWEKRREAGKTFERVQEDDGEVG